MRQLGGGRVGVEEPAVQVPRHVDGGAVVEEDDVAAAEVPAEPAELHDPEAVDGDPGDVDELPLEREQCRR